MVTIESLRKIAEREIAISFSRNDNVKLQFAKIGSVVME